MKLHQNLATAAGSIDYHYTVAGVPHVVIEVADIDQAPVVEIGREVRRHAAFLPDGANVNFVFSDGEQIAMRTYERGVEDETLACGTGAVASSAIMVLLGKTASPVKVLTRSGQMLEVSLEIMDERPISVWLEGPADLIYTGAVVLTRELKTP